MRCGGLLAEVFPPEFLQEFDRLRGEQGVCTLYKFRLPTPTGEARTANITIAPLLNRDFQAVGRIVIVDDITDRINMETQLTQAEKLSSIGLLAAGVAHEVNTPLAVISSYAQMLGKQLVGSSHGRSYAARLQPVLEKITQQTFRASEIVNGLLNFSRMGSGRVRSRGPERHGARHGPAARAPDALVGRRRRDATSPTDLPSISGNRGKLQQVLVNLILNAKDALQDKRLGRDPSSHRTHVQGSRDPGRQTTASGMPQEVMRKIYDPFFTTKSNPAGGPAQRHRAWAGGHLRHRAGARRHDRGRQHGRRRHGLPPGVPCGRSPAPQRRRGPRSRTGRTLMLSMQQERQYMLSAHLQNCAGDRTPSAQRPTHPRSSTMKRASAIRSRRCSRWKASAWRWPPTAHAGLDLLTRHSYDLLLLDLALPGESGIDLLPRIKSLAPELPVIMITAYGTVGNVVDAIRAGASNFIQKPWDNEKLLADIRTAIGKQPAEAEVVQLKRTLKQRYSFENIVGKSEPMLRLFDLVAQVAPSRSTVLIQGESGTGKELIAKAIHAQLAAARQAVHPGKHRRGAFRPAGVHTLRPRARRVYFCRRGQEGPVRGRRRRHAVSGRDRHHEHGHAGQDPARAAGPPLHACGRNAGDPGRCAHRRGDQRQPAAGRERRPLPRRSFLSPERHLP